MNAKLVAWRLATGYGSPFRARSQLAVVPNVSWSMLDWEADLLVLSKAGFLTEIEIKISLSDWKADFAKKKFGNPGCPDALKIKYFYYAAPKKLADRHPELALPEGAGVVSVDADHGINVLKKAVARTGHRKLTDCEQQRILRLAAIKAWGLFHKPEATDG